MEDDVEDSNRIVYSHQDKDIIFKVDYNNRRFADVFERKQRIFDGNYLQFIRKIENPIVKEIWVLIRKYQYFFTKLQLNKILLFDFTKSSDYLLTDIEKYYEDEEHTNTFTFEMSILPKFKKNEINFEIPEDLLTLSISIECSDTIEPIKSFVEITNFKNSKEIEPVINNLLSILMSKTLDSFLESYRDNFIQALNKFLTYVENYFPEIHKKAFEQQLLQKDIWSQSEQDRLEEALLKYASEKIAKDKFRKVAEFVKTKSLAECVKRYKKLAELAKGSDEVKNKEDVFREDVTAKIFTQAKEMKPKDEENLISIQPVKKEVKLHPNNDVSKIEKSDARKEEDLIVIPKSSNTYDLVDDLINQFNSLYENVTFDSRTDDPYTMEDAEDYDEKEYESEELADELENINGITKGEGNSGNRKKRNVQSKSNNPNTNAIKSNDEEAINIKYSPSQITPQNLQLIRNTFKLGDKSSFSLGGLVIKNIALGEISEPKFFVKCGKCKQIGFETVFIKLNKKFNIFYNGAICPKCKNEMHIIFKSELLHPENLQTAGIIFSTGVIIVDFLPMTYLINCLNCTDTYKKVKLRLGGLPVNDNACLTCRNELLFYIYNGNVSPTAYNDFSFLDTFEIQHFQKFNLTIEDTSGEYIKKYDRLFQVGTPLPDKGVCRHYKLSFRWFRFDCCSKMFPCDRCHDEISNHDAEYAKNILCGHCSVEQSSQNEICQKCGKNFTREQGNGFWEGGKGCRNKAMMSSKDNHKFKNSNLKTISKKKMAELDSKK